MKPKIKRALYVFGWIFWMPIFMACLLYFQFRMIAQGIYYYVSDGDTELAQDKFLNAMDKMVSMY